MDKNTIWGFILMALVVFGFMWLNKPSEEEIQARKAELEQAEREANAQAEAARQRALRFDSITPAEAGEMTAAVTRAGVKDSAGVVAYRTSTVDLTVADGQLGGTVKAIDTLVNVKDVLTNNLAGLSPQRAKAANANLREAAGYADRYGALGSSLNGDSTTVQLRNKFLAIDIATKGGAITQATLMDYNSYVGGDTTLVRPITPGDGTYGFVMTSANQRFDTRQFYFTPVQENDSTVLMRLDMGAGAYWGMRYTLPKDSYVVKMEVVQHGKSDLISPSMTQVEMMWHQKMARNEVGRTFEERNSAIYYKYCGEKPDYLSESADDSEQLNQKLQWVSFKNQFFSSVIIPKGNFSSADVKSTVLKDDPRYLKDMDMKAVLDYSATSEKPLEFDIFIGPNLYPLLSSLDDTIDTKEDLQLTHLIPLGWKLFRWINTLIIIPVFTFLGSFITNYGIIILLLTIFIKIIIFPFTYKSYKSQAKMRVLAPEIKEINDKYPGQENAMTRQQKTMALYSSAGASPMAGCLPMLLQMPILIAMFTFFPSCIELRGESFLWAHDLSAPDVIFTLPFSIPFYGSHVSLFCLLMTVTNIIYTRINMQNQPTSSSMPGMKWMMYLMPVMFLFFFNDYASGLSYYYFLSLLITIVQTYIFRRCVNEDKVRAAMAAHKAKPKKKSGFMARLEEAQRKQQAMIREQQKKQQGGGKRR